MKLMRNKYGIDFDDELISIESKFTMETIAHRFPSITLDMIYNNDKHMGLQITLTDFSILFPYFNLPKTFFRPLIVTVLPKLKDLPIAIILIAVYVY